MMNKWLMQGQRFSIRWPDNLDGMQVIARAHARACMHSYICTHAYAHAHMHTPTRTHAQAHAHAHTEHGTPGPELQGGPESRPSRLLFVIDQGLPGKQSHTLQYQGSNRCMKPFFRLEKMCHSNMIQGFLRHSAKLVHCSYC